MKNMWGIVGESGNKVSLSGVKIHVHGGIPPYNRQ